MKNIEEVVDRLIDFRLIVVVEAVFGVLLIHFRSYTEIDWETYMIQCKGFLSGDYDYLNLKGPSGPLVYPAGFLYIFSIFYYICSAGSIRVLLI